MLFKKITSMYFRLSLNGPIKSTDSELNRFATKYRVHSTQKNVHLETNEYILIILIDTLYKVKYN